MRVLCSRQVQTKWTRCDLSRVLGAGPTGPVWHRVFVFLWSDWLRASEYYIQRGQSLTGARRGQTVTVASVHLKTTRGRVCFRRSSSIRKRRPAASQTFGREWTHGRPTTAANQRALFPEFEGRNNKLWLEEMLILVSVYNQWIKFTEVPLTDVYQTRPRSIQWRCNNQSLSLGFLSWSVQINKIVLSSDDEFNIILDFWSNKTINI